MKKVLAIVMALAMVFALCACGEKSENITLTKGKLTVATSPDFAPYEFYSVDEAGNYNLSGFDVALAKYIAEYMGLELEIIPMDFDGVLAELAAGNVDLGLAGLSPDPEREDGMDFSDLYYLGGQSFNKLISSEFSATVRAVTDAGKMNNTITLSELNEYTFGKLLFFFEMAAAAAGEFLNINAFNQPGVEAGKLAAYSLMGKSGCENIIRPSEFSAKSESRLVFSV